MNSTNEILTLFVATMLEVFKYANLSIKVLAIYGSVY